MPEALPNKPLKLTAAGFSPAGGRARHEPWLHHARPQLSGHPLGGGSLNHIYWVRPGKLCGRPGPSEVPWSIADLRAAGVQSVLTLCERQDVSNLKAEGFSHARFSLPTNVPPQPQDDDVCRGVIPDAVAFLEAEVESGRCVLVHCAAGRDRTAMVLASYLAATTGLEAAQAISAVRLARPDALIADGWEAMARRVISSLWR